MGRVVFAIEVPRKVGAYLIHVKYRLMTPGPTAIPESVLAKFSEPIIHHRTSMFESEFKQLRDHLQWLFQTKNDVLTLTATGTGAMEAAVTNLFQKVMR